ncbi:peptidylprolyl isomerase, partial [Pseudomonas syringae]
SASVDVDYVVVKPTMFTAENQQITDAELQHAYTQYVDAQKTNAPKHVSHILVTEDNRSDADAKKLINEISAKIKSGLS